MVIINLELHFGTSQAQKGLYFFNLVERNLLRNITEVISEFIDRGYAVAMMDWRGQGLSSRVSKNIRIGHIDNFKTFDDDFIKIVEECFKTRCPSPFIGFGHSMGGCLLASYFISKKNLLEKCILCAPMVSVRANAMSEEL